MPQTHHRIAPIINSTLVAPWVTTFSLEVRPDRKSPFGRAISSMRAGFLSLCTGAEKQPENIMRGGFAMIAGRDHRLATLTKISPQI
jgi:hypothetical protein